MNAKKTRFYAGAAAFAAYALLWLSACAPDLGFLEAANETAHGFVPVLDIADSGTAGGLPLQGAIPRTGSYVLPLHPWIIPQDATKQSIVWTITRRYGGTDAYLNDDALVANTGGTVELQAAIADGMGQGRPYTETFTLTILDLFVPVTDIAWTPASTYAQTGGTLILSLDTAVVSPQDATDHTIIWTVANPGTVTNGGQPLTLDAGGRTLTVNGNELGASPTVTLIATVADGNGLGNAYNKTFPITFTSNFVPATNITISVPPVIEVPATGLIYDIPTTVTPSNASNQAIAWTYGNPVGTDAYITQNLLTASFSGTPGNPATVDLTATITDGGGPGIHIIRTFTVSLKREFVPVQNIGGIPLSVAPGITTPLSPVVSPPEATEQTIVWAFKSGTNTLGATLTASPEQLNATMTTGTITLTATIANGLGPGVSYTQDFNILISFVPVTDITGITGTMTAGSLELSGQVQPLTATMRRIDWSVKTDNTVSKSVSPAHFDGSTLVAPSGGSVVVTATVAGGVSLSPSPQGTPYTKDFTVTVRQNPVMNISGIPATKMSGVPLVLTPIVEPAGATQRAVVWTVTDTSAHVSAYMSGANTLTADLSPGYTGFGQAEYVKLRADIDYGVNANAPFDTYYKTFTVAVKRFTAIYLDTNNSYTRNTVLITYRDGQTRTLARNGNVYSANLEPRGEIVKSVTTDAGIVYIGRNDTELITVSLSAAGVIQKRPTDANGFIRIGTRADFQAISSYGLGGKYLLEGEIDLMGDLAAVPGWTPLGQATPNGFTGTFDGGQYAIKNIKVDMGGIDQVGLFAFTGHATLANIYLMSGSILGNNEVGGIGGLLAHGTVENCSTGTTLTVIGADRVGGIGGHLYGSGSGGMQVFHACINRATVTATAGSAGGITGYNDHGNQASYIIACYNTGAITGSSAAGGITGHNIAPYSGDNIVACYNAGDITSTGGTNAGHILGKTNNTYNLYITDCYYSPSATRSGGPGQADGNVFGDTGSGGLWPTNNYLIQWGVVDVWHPAGAGYWWQSMGGWYGGGTNMQPPKLWWEN